MNTINELRYVENKVRANNQEIKDKGDKYLLNVKNKKKIRYDNNNTDNENTPELTREEFLKNFHKRVRTAKKMVRYTADCGDIEYFSDSSSNSSQDDKIRSSNIDKRFQMRRLQYISCLNLGKIKKVNVSKLYEYGIVFNEATGKYEKQNQVCPIEDPVNKLIKENADIWTERFTPENIIQTAINDRIKKYPELKKLSNKTIFTTGFNPESILLTAISVKRNKMAKQQKT